MENFDLFLNAVVILLPTFLSIVVAKTTSPGKGWRIGFIAFGVFLSVLVLFQQLRTKAYYESQRAEQANQQRDLKQKLDQSLLTQEYMRGQLESIGVMVGKLGEKTSNSDLKQLAAAIVNASANAAKLSQRRQHTGRIPVPGKAIQATIIHGFNDPNRLVSVFPLPSWGASAWIVSQDATSVTFGFSGPAPDEGGDLSWLASWRNEP